MQFLEKLAVAIRNVTCLPNLHLLTGITLAIYTRNRLSKLHVGRVHGTISFVHQVFLLFILAEEFYVYLGPYIFKVSFDTYLHILVSG